jgi:hypothetical protein
MSVAVDLLVCKEILNQVVYLGISDQRLNRWCSGVESCCGRAIWLLNHFSAVLVLSCYSSVWPSCRSYDASSWCSTTSCACWISVACASSSLAYNVSLLLILTPKKIKVFCTKALSWDGSSRVNNVWLRISACKKILNLFTCQKQSIWASSSCSYAVSCWDTISAVMGASFGRNIDTCVWSTTRSWNIVITVNSASCVIDYSASTWAGRLAALIRASKHRQVSRDVEIVLQKFLSGESLGIVVWHLWGIN